MKTHFAHIEYGNESNPNTEKGTTLCGLEYYESPATDKVKFVTCKKCLNSYPNYKKKWEEEVKKGFF